MVPNHRHGHTGSTRVLAYPSCHRLASVQLTALGGERRGSPPVKGGTAHLSVTTRCAGRLRKMVPGFTLVREKEPSVPQILRHVSVAPPRSVSSSTVHGEEMTAAEQCTSSSRSVRQVNRNLSRTPCSVDVRDADCSGFGDAHAESCDLPDTCCRAATPNGDLLRHAASRAASLPTHLHSSHHRARSRGPRGKTAVLQLRRPSGSVRHCVLLDKFNPPRPR
jgi:hypothetical protein